MSKLNRAVEYSEMQLQTAGKLKSLQLLHAGAVRFLKMAVSEPETRNENIVKVGNIITQLQISLRLGEEDLAEVLFYLYDYIYSLLDKGDEESLQNAIMVFDHLSQTLRMMGFRRPVMAQT